MVIPARPKAGCFASLFIRMVMVIVKSENGGDRNKSVEKMAIEHKSVKRKGAEEGSIMTWMEHSFRGLTSGIASLLLFITR